MSGELQSAEQRLAILEAELEETYRSVTELTNELEEKNEALENALQELQETYRQLILKEKMASLGNLVAGVAHEINTPLGAVLSASSTMKAAAAKLEELLHPSEPAGEGGRRTRLERVLGVVTGSAAVSEEASLRIAKIIGALRNFARLDEAEYQEADIHEGIDSTLALLQHELGDRIEVIRNYGELPRIECSPSQLNQVFMNLLVNAIQAIPENGSITVTTRVRGDNVQVEVADTGRGIDPNQINRIFDPGFTTKGVGVGAGLGLSISYKIVEQHHGRIEAASSPGEGATFIVRLPMRPARPEKES